MKQTYRHRDRSDILREEFMKPMGITARQLSSDMVNLQTEYDMRMVTRNSLDKLAPCIRVFQPAEA